MRHLETLSTLASLDTNIPFKARIQTFERELIEEALERSRGNQKRAARILQIPLRTLVHKIGRYQLRRPRATPVSTVTPAPESAERSSEMATEAPLLDHLAFAVGH